MGWFGLWMFLSVSIVAFTYTVLDISEKIEENCVIINMPEDTAQKETYDYRM